MPILPGKVLPEVFAADPDRMARFEREARVCCDHCWVAVGVISPESLFRESCVFNEKDGLILGL